VGEPLAVALKVTTLLTCPMVPVGVTFVIAGAPPVVGVVTAYANSNGSLVPDPLLTVTRPTYAPAAPSVSLGADSVDVSGIAPPPKLQFQEVGEWVAATPKGTMAPGAPTVPVGDTSTITGMVDPPLAVDPTEYVNANWGELPLAFVTVRCPT